MRLEIEEAMDTINAHAPMGLDELDEAIELVGLILHDHARLEAIETRSEVCYFGGSGHGSGIKFT